MKRIFYIAAFLVTLLVCGCGEEESSRPKLVMATNAEFPPYEYMEGFNIDGIDPAIVRYIGDKLGYEVVIDNMKFDSVIAAIQTGKADIAASGLTITEERKAHVLFSIPYIVAEQLIIVPKGSSIKTKADLKGKRVGVQQGTTGDIYMTENIQEPQRFKNGAFAVSVLRKGMLDAVVIDNEPAKVYVQKISELIILEDPLTTEEYAFAFNKNDAELCEKFNAELQKLKDSGKLEEIIREYKAKNMEEIVADADTIWGKLKQSIHSNFINKHRYTYLLHGLLVTLLITVCAVLIGIVIGFLVAIVRSTAEQTKNKGVILKILDALCKVYLTVIRGTPVVVQLMIIYLVIFGSVDFISQILAAIIAFGINSGAYVAEIFRAGIMSIDRGQLEAGRSLGLSYPQTMCSIIVPQAFKNVLPALGNELIVLLKETSVAGYIALEDLTKGGEMISSQTYDAFMPLVVVALIYLMIVMLLSFLLRCLERRLKTNE